MIPFGVSGVIKEIKRGEFTVDDTIAVVATDAGERKITMLQKWPVRKGRPLWDSWDYQGPSGRITGLPLLP